MTEPVFGLKINRSSTEARPAIFSDLSVIGLVLPSDDADAERFPLNDPIEFNSNDGAYLQDLGTGPAFLAVDAINAQLADFQVAARIVLVRVNAGNNIDETITNIVGNQGGGTGIYALLKSGEKLGVIPRLIGAPGFTGKFERSTATVDVTRQAKPGGNTGNGVMTLAGTPYVAGVQSGTYKVRITGGARSATLEAPAGNTGNGILGTLTADATAPVGVWSIVCQIAAANAGTFAVIRPDGTLDGLANVGVAYNGGINFTIADGSTDFVVGDDFNVAVAVSVPANGGTFSVLDQHDQLVGNGVVGTPFSDEIAFTIADGSTDFIPGDGFDVVVVKNGGVASSNPVIAALPAVLNQLIAHAVVNGPTLTKQDAIDLRETINSDRIIFADNRAQRLVGGQLIYQDLANLALGIAVKRDYQHAGIPSHSWANEPLQGILRLERADGFSLVDGATQGQELLLHNISIAARGELGVETAAANSGFVFIGTDNCGDDPLWQFYNVTRMRDFIHLAILRILRLRLGRQNITPQTVQDVMNDLEFLLRDLQTDFHILGYKVEFRKDNNSPEELRLGHLRVAFKAEEAPVLRKITVDSERYRQALEFLLDDLITQANTLIA